MLNRIIIHFITILCLTISSISCGGSVNNNEFPLSEIIELDENNWRAMLHDEWMVEFFAPWCPACKTLAPNWEKFAVSSGKYNLHVAKIDVTKSPSLSGRFFVTALPTIYHVTNGEFRQYRGPRNVDSFLEYVKEKQWKKIEPLSAWKQPNSIHMSILSWFFKLSHYLKDVNTRLHEEYGLPTWGSYALFAIATIFIGAILGLFLVCIVDFLYPPKKVNRQSYSDAKTKDGTDNKIGGGIEDIAGDEIEDEEQEEDGENEENNDNGGNDSTSEGEKNSGDDEDEDGSEDAPESEKTKRAKRKDDNSEKVNKENDTTNNSEIRERKPIKKDETSLNSD